MLEGAGHTKLAETPSAATPTGTPTGTPTAAAMPTATSAIPDDEAKSQEGIMLSRSNIKRESEAEFGVATFLEGILHHKHVSLLPVALLRGMEIAPSNIPVSLGKMHVTVHKGKHLGMIISLSNILYIIIF